mmetsp:Transcript_26476/g.56743  ORF Transcript_26476/g.56743 Transcript_26476/m.56743 type:complete len:395 (-) Transcript_26476:428-1612(-)|eukprot:CAMPEP_0201118804 /NCGR_PEP_ID=MMETSP0850-20130426/2989_1 /ASSEMBLY_ACC=CAM_ASM_000622 /TAXON_ID=183588 /ORGANISM="Pseudo-nitzschia fraudulenta, Strain WWA7" /LENGTH=394 /DNA_ID=CAMNT_0047384235 /DNA_START=305 /DNA_END=1489 /DNA_ORIENTATION=-
MTASVLPSHSTQTQVKVNVRLCGSIPRLALSMMQQEAPNGSRNIQSLPLFPSSSEHQESSSVTRINVTKRDENYIAKHLFNQLFNMQKQEDQSSKEPKQPTQPQHNFFPGAATPFLPRSPPTYEAPSWAVPANGEARLEPVCDSVHRQAPVDLTSRAVFRVGRSPQSDVPLMHVTSSRRHAMLFHHSNGSCYLVDCGSAHGTYINGVRVTSTPNDSNVVVPTRVRRGSIVRFGGPGAPSFMLKSFSFDLDEMKDCPLSGVDLCPMSIPPSPVLTAMVQHNTRLNSLGQTAKEELMVHRQISSKRSFDSMETVMDSDDEIDHLKPLTSLRSPPLSPEQPLRLVSPELNCPCTSSNTSSCKRRRVTFSDHNQSTVYPFLVSPDVSSDEHENECCTE